MPAPVLFPEDCCHDIARNSARTAFCRLPPQRRFCRDSSSPPTDGGALWKLEFWAAAQGASQSTAPKLTIAKQVKSMCTRDLTTAISNFRAVIDVEVAGTMPLTCRQLTTKARRDFPRAIVSKMVDCLRPSRSTGWRPLPRPRRCCTRESRPSEHCLRCRCSLRLRLPARREKRPRPFRRRWGCRPSRWRVRRARH